MLDRPDDRALSRHVKTVFRCWIFLFGLVGSQMGWVLRPFIGDPDGPVQFFREGAWDNAHVVVWRMIQESLGLARRSLSISRTRTRTGGLDVAAPFE